MYESLSDDLQHELLADFLPRTADVVSTLLKVRTQMCMTYFLFTIVTRSFPASVAGEFAHIREKADIGPGTRTAIVATIELSHGELWPPPPAFVDDFNDSDDRKIRKIREKADTRSRGHDRIGARRAVVDAATRR
jgi:hypothetical protein